MANCLPYRAASSLVSSYLLLFTTYLNSTPVTAMGWFDHDDTHEVSRAAAASAALCFADEQRRAYEEVQYAGEEHKAKLSHELIGGAAAFAAMKAYQDHQEANG